MGNVIIVGAGGFIGAALRYLASMGINRLVQTGFPFATFFVNVLGAFLIGFLSQLFEQAYPDKKQLLLFLTTGILGGFTTFSTFSLETVNLFQNGKAFFAVANVVLSVICGILGILLGKMLAKSVA